MCGMQNRKFNQSAWTHLQNIDVSVWIGFLTIVHMHTLSKYMYVYLEDCLTVKVKSIWGK